LPPQRWKQYLKYKRGHTPTEKKNRPDGTRQCKLCQEWKMKSEFQTGKAPDNRIVISSYCLPCASKVGMSNRIKKYGSLRAYWLMRRYNLTLDEFEKMRQQFNGNCAICRSCDAVVVDHCHESGRVRGILCQKCNLALGAIGDTEAHVKNLLSYLQT
jgi:hypothetical protein